MTGSMRGTRSPRPADVPMADVGGADRCAGVRPFMSVEVLVLGAGLVAIATGAADGCFARRTVAEVSPSSACAGLCWASQCLALSWPNVTVFVVPCCSRAHSAVRHQSAVVGRSVLRRTTGLISKPRSRFRPDRSSRHGTQGISPYVIGAGRAYSALDAVQAAAILGGVTVESRCGVGTFAGRQCGAVHGPRSAGPHPSLDGVAALAPTPPPDRSVTGPGKTRRRPR
jgi:hypothetical protein